MFHKYAVHKRYLHEQANILTLGRVGWTKLQRISQNEVVVPHVELVISGIVIHCGDILVLVGEGDIHILSAVQSGIVDVVDGVLACLTLIVLIN